MVAAAAALPPHDWCGAMRGTSQSLAAASAVLTSVGI